ncbi:MAG: hypothetical protein EXR71_16730 [Myxococcales bacterium]|nr:hypothetical protein [Myxococcales bacterium]
MVLVLTLAACSATHPAQSPDLDSATGQSETADPCADAATLDWDNFGHGFLIQHCNGCHAASADDRHGAPLDHTYDTVEDAWTHAEGILARAASASPSMPPRGGVSDDDRVQLFWWLACGEVGR